LLFLTLSIFVCLHPQRRFYSLNIALPTVGLHTVLSG